MEKKNRYSLKSGSPALRYLGLSTQLLGAIGIGIFAGYKLDKWLHTLPVFSCVLPLLILAGFYIKLARQLNNRKKE